MNLSLPGLTGQSSNHRPSLTNQGDGYWIPAFAGMTRKEEMIQRGLSLGFFNRFGRSAELRAFDQALRAVDLHPNLVPEAVKLTAVRLLTEHAGGGAPEAQSYREAAGLIAYCMVGAETFAGGNHEGAAAEIERRIETALDSGSSLDAKLVLLTLHARVIQPSVVEFFQLESGAE
jgi:hypothetical protein